MSTQSINSPKPDKAGELGPAMKGADVLVSALEHEGVEVVFAYPGGASMELHQSLTRSEKIRTILPRQEQGGGFMAHGYARATGKAGVCMATSGPGATNLVTCIADAFMDSIPLVAITGQVYQQFIGKAAFQETDFFGMTLPIVKHSYLVLTAEDLPKVVKEAFYLATSGRPGPVVIDIPKDVQQKVFEPFFPAEVSPLEGYKLDHPTATDEELNEVLDLISKAKKPVLYTGGGIISAEAHQELKEFAELTGLPVTHTLMGLGVFDPDHDQSLYWYGMHGTVAGNWAVCESDLLICAGARFDDRITGLVSKYAPDAYVIHFDVDQSEHNKNVHAHFPIKSDIKYALNRLSELIKKGGFEKPDLSSWSQTIAGWKKDYPFKYEKGEHITSQEAVDVLYQESKGEAIITTGVGQHQMWAAQYFKFHEPNRWMTSGGLGTMGYGLPAAVGTQLAHPESLVIDISGEASFLMNMQELSTISQYRLPVKIFILNNEWMGMVRQWQELNHGSRYSESYTASLPDFVKLAETFGMKGLRAQTTAQLDDVISEMLAYDGPVIVDCMVEKEENCFPMIPSGAAHNDMLLADDQGLEVEVSDEGKALV